MTKAVNTRYGDQCFDPMNMACPVCRRRMNATRIVTSGAKAFIDITYTCGLCMTEVKVMGLMKSTVEYTEYEETTEQKQLTNATKSLK